MTHQTHLAMTSVAQVMQVRMAMYGRIRRFFQQRHVSEVETPILSSYGSTDVHIDSFVTHWQGRKMYLYTSPEFYMKRLLAADFGDCFQIGKVFRHEDNSRRHLPEFSLLEWYRLGFSTSQLIAEVFELIKTLHQPWEKLPMQVISYADAFANIGVNPHQDSLQELRRKTTEIVGYCPNLDDNRDEWLDFLTVTQIEPTLGQNVLTFLTHYPASMAALAKKTRDADGNWVAERFELYYQGIELANGFYELTDADEQQARFEADNDRRQQLGKPVIRYDQGLIDALRQGLPACSGVALGLDRLLMLMLDKRDINDVAPPI